MVGDASTVEDGAIIHASVKIWPDKQIEAGASVTSSIVWGQQGQRMLFRRHRVSGLINVDMTPEFATKLGAAYGATLPLGSTDRSLRSTVISLPWKSLIKSWLGLG